MSTMRTMALALSLVACLTSATLACEGAGPNAHIGVVLALGQNSLTLKDAESGVRLTFVATPQQLRGIAVRDTVTVVFSSDGEALVAKSVTKG
jgi:hypothetical protein